MTTKQITTLTDSHGVKISVIKKQQCGKTRNWALMVRITLPLGYNDGTTKTQRKGSQIRTYLYDCVDRKITERYYRKDNHVIHLKFDRLDLDVIRALEIHAQSAPRKESLPASGPDSLPTPAAVAAEGISPTEQLRSLFR